MATISTQQYLLDQAKRRITTSPLITLPGMGLVEKRLLEREWPQHPMAMPPAGSDLRPVMGDARAADPRAHDRDVPRRPRLLAGRLP